MRHEEDSFRALTRSESDLGVDPFDIAYPPGDVRRYGADPFGNSPSTQAFQIATNTGHPVYIPEGTFWLDGAVTFTGKTVWTGEGEKSIIRCDSDVLIVTNGTGSLIDNFYLENITAPWIITRNPGDWLAPNLINTLQQSNGDGYQPTINDVDSVNDIWNNLSSAQKNQNIGPVITFTGAASNITVSRIYGRFVRVEILDAIRSVVRDCNFRGGKGTWGAINFDNATNGVQTGVYNKAINNTIRYASYNGIIFQANTDCVIEGNSCDLCGESGIKPAGSGARACQGAVVSSNACHRNYYDGIDLVTSFPVTDTASAYHQCVGNYCYGNGGNGINVDGRYNAVLSNKLSFNSRYGIWGITSDSQFCNNYAYDNNRSRVSSQHEILVNGTNNLINGNRVFSGPGQNSNAIFVDATKACVIDGNQATGSTFFFGNPGAVASIVGPTNIDDSTGAESWQCFTLAIANNGGTIQHNISDTGGSGSSYSITRITGASSSNTNTHTGTDSTISMSGGGKIGSANTNTFHLDTAAQNTNRTFMIASIAYNDTGTALTVRARITSIDINGTTRPRPILEFFNAASGAPYALTGIPSGNQIQVEFFGKIA